MLFPSQYDVQSLNVTYNENYYNSLWCDEHLGHKEVVLPDRTRCDCIVLIHGVMYAVEMDWEKKFYEALGQSLHYATVTGYRPAIVLITEHEYSIYEERLQRVVKRFQLPVQIWKIQRKRN